MKLDSLIARVALGLACAWLTACPHPPVEKGDGKTTVTMNGDGTFTAEGPSNTCLQFNDTAGKPVSDPIELGPSGSVTAPVPKGAHGWTAEPCETGGSEKLIVGPFATANRLTRYLVEGGVFSDLSVHSFYALEVEARSFGEARVVAASVANAWTADPLSWPGPPAPPAGVEIRSFVATLVDYEEAAGAAGQALVFSLSETPHSEWEVQLNGVVHPANPEAQLASGLWLASTSLPYAQVALEPGALNTVLARRDTDLVPAAEILDRYWVPAAVPDEAGFDR